MASRYLHPTYACSIQPLDGIRMHYRLTATHLEARIRITSSRRKPAAGSGRTFYPNPPVSSEWWGIGIPDDGSGKGAAAIIGFPQFRRDRLPPTHFAGTAVFRPTSSGPPGTESSAQMEAQLLDLDPSGALEGQRVTAWQSTRDDELDDVLISAYHELEEDIVSVNGACTTRTGGRFPGGYTPYCHRESPFWEFSIRLAEAGGNLAVSALRPQNLIFSHGAPVTATTTNTEAGYAASFGLGPPSGPAKS